MYNVQVTHLKSHSGSAEVSRCKLHSNANFPVGWNNSYTQRHNTHTLKRGLSVLHCMHTPFMGATEKAGCGCRKLSWKSKSMGTSQWRAMLREAASPSGVGGNLTWRGKEAVFITG